MIDKCEQDALDFNWSLTRKNACHIGVMNNEMGQVVAKMEELKDDVNSKMSSMTISVDSQISDVHLSIERIETYQEVSLWLWGAVVASVVALVIKKMWGK